MVFFFNYIICRNIITIMFRQYHDIRNIGLGTKAPGITFPRRRRQVPRNWVLITSQNKDTSDLSAPRDTGIIIGLISVHLWNESSHKNTRRDVKGRPFLRQLSSRIRWHHNRNWLWTVEVVEGARLARSLHGEDDESARRRESVQSSSPLRHCHLESRRVGAGDSHPPAPLRHLIWGQLWLRLSDSVAPGCCIQAFATFRWITLWRLSSLGKIPVPVRPIFCKNFFSLHSKGNAGQQHLAPAQGPPWA